MRLLTSSIQVLYLNIHGQNYRINIRLFTFFLNSGIGNGWTRLELLDVYRHDDANYVYHQKEPLYQEFLETLTLAMTPSQQLFLTSTSPVYLYFFDMELVLLKGSADNKKKIIHSHNTTNGGIHPVSCSWHPMYFYLYLSIMLWFTLNRDLW